jgi:hypothetical protein
MKIKFLFLTAVCLAVTSIGFAQSKTAAVTPETVVKNLYAAQKNDKTNPFFQTKSRALLDKFFTKDFADAIWKDSKDANGEVGTIDFDPLYAAQDTTGLSGLTIRRMQDLGGADNAFVIAKFKLMGKDRNVQFEVLRQDGKTWKINDIIYEDTDSLGGRLRYAQDPETKKNYDELTFKGDYTVGSQRCNVDPSTGFMFYRVRCGKPEETVTIREKEEFEIYAVDGDEKQTSYIMTDLKTNKTKTFTFKNGEMNGTFKGFDGKTVPVTQIKVAENETEDERGAGELNVGKTTSAIVYVGMESGDYAAYCFDNNSEVGRKIMAVCKKGEQCEVTGEIDYEAKCNVEGLEATLSSSGKILKVVTVKKLIGKKTGGKK